MKCLECRGACCEEFKIPDSGNRKDDASRWLALHATTDGKFLTFETRCTALTSEGSCHIYSSRPMVCVNFIAGGHQCLETVKRRRTPEQYRLIREGDDPEIL